VVRVWGHTARIKRTVCAPELLGETRDDAVGWVFDKGAELLGLPCRGGRALSRAAQGVEESAYALPRPLQALPGLDFSYSGLKTAVARVVERAGPLSDSRRADLAASFQAAATDVLVSRTRRAARQEGLHRVAVVGGVAANQRLRRAMGRAAERDGLEVFFPPPELCTDNAVMVAAAGARLLARGERHPWSLSAFSRVPLGESPWAEAS